MTVKIPMITNKFEDSNEKIDFEALAKGFKKASDIIRMENPNFILAPVAGAVPFVDMLNIVDRKFNLGSVIYLPNSSRFGNREQLMAEWYNKFYDSNEFGKPLKLMCIDEVLSGASATAGYNQFQKSIEVRAAKKANLLFPDMELFDKVKRSLNKNVDYKILGFAEKGYDRNPEFERICNSGLVHLVEFDDIPTIDNIVYNTIRFKVDRVQSNGKPIYLPEIDKFEVTPQYMALLSGLAQYVGVDPSSVNPVNLTKIEDGLRQAQPVSK